MVHAPGCRVAILGINGPFHVNMQKVYRFLASTNILRKGEVSETVPASMPRPTPPLPHVLYTVLRLSRSPITAGRARLPGHGGAATIVQCAAANLVQMAVLKTKNRKYYRFQCRGDPFFGYIF